MKGFIKINLIFLLFEVGIFKSFNIYVKVFCYIIYCDLGLRFREVFLEVNIYLIEFVVVKRLKEGVYLFKLKVRFF